MALMFWKIYFFKLFSSLLKILRLNNYLYLHIGPLVRYFLCHKFMRQMVVQLWYFAKRLIRMFTSSIFYTKVVKESWTPLIIQISSTWILNHFRLSFLRTFRYIPYRTFRNTCECFATKITIPGNVIETFTRCVVKWHR